MRNNRVQPATVSDATNPGVSVPANPAEERNQSLEAVNKHLVAALQQAENESQAAIEALSEMEKTVGLDVLTGLPNRAVLLDRFAGAIANAKRHGTRLALMFLDLNNFKHINDTLGHAAGDQVLKRVASSMVSLVREIDTVSRVGGDEFLILLPEVSQSTDAMLIADKVIEMLSIPSRAGDHVLRIGVSIGISIYPDDSDDPVILIDRADAAMYRAKRHRLGGVAFHSADAADERKPAPSSAKEILSPLTHYDTALAEHDRLHAELREANERLIIAALSAQQLQAAAERARARQTELLAVVAHQLLNPLGPIRNAAAMLEHASTDAPMLLRLQGIIERQTGHIARLVSDLVDVSRIETGKLRLELETVETTYIIDVAVDTCRHTIDARLQSIHVAPCAFEITMRCDPIRLVQIIGNLLNNASKYTPQGGMIKLSAVLVDSDLVLVVSDNGIGISAEALPHVFDPFVQDARAVGFDGSGLGIGLTVVRELVSAHGGTVVASSGGSGLGSEFVVTLPVAGPPSVVS